MEGDKNAKNKKAAEKEGTSSAVPRKPAGEKNTLEHRLDYVCNFLSIKKDQAKDIT